jgi:hypothetical protein
MTDHNCVVIAIATHQQAQRPLWWALPQAWQKQM